MKIFKLVKPYLFKRKGTLIFFTFCSTIIWFTSILTPYVTARYIDYIEGIYKSHVNKSLNGIYIFTGILIILWLTEILGNFFYNMSNAKLQCNTVYEFNYGILEHIKRLHISFFNNVDAAYLNQRINSDSNTLVSFILNNFIQLFMKGSTFIICLVILFSINIKIATMLLILIPIYIVIYIYFKKPIYNSSYECSELQNKLFSKMNEQINNIKFIKMNSFYKLLGEQLNSSFGFLYNATMKYAKISYKFGSVDLFIKRLCSLLIFFYGGFEVINGNLTIGNFININSYFLILLGCTSFFLNIGKAYQDALVAYSRVNELLDMEEEFNGNLTLNHVNKIEFENVTFSYDNSKKILKDFNYSFEKNNIYCIVGKNGVGKSTLIALLMGLFNKDYVGNIYYDSFDLKQLDLHHLREHIMGITEQEPILLGNTIMNNLTLGLKDISMENIEMWCKDLNIYDFINSLPMGFDYNISEKATNISGGQKQKISQARIFLKNPQIILLDEPTSALDVESIEKLKCILQKIKKDRIIIAITHNNELLTVADKVINFEELLA